MKRAIWAGLLLVAAPITGIAAQNWNATYVETAEGHRVGNPDADVSMIAFVSYSCSHCASFEVQSDAALRLAYIQPGKVNVEVRHVIRNPLDLAAALATECGAEDKFWANHRTIMRAQDRWLQVAMDASPAQSQRWTSGAFGARMRAIAADLDFYELMETRGYSATQLDQCLNDEAAAQDIVARMQANNARWNITGTPSFVINGALLDGVHNWASLQPALSSATE